jgi:hypothetical protein
VQFIDTYLYASFKDSRQLNIFVGNFLVQFWILVKQQILCHFLLWFSGLVHHTFSTGVIYCYGQASAVYLYNLFTYITQFITKKRTAWLLKCLCLSEENMVSPLYIEQDSGQKVVNEKPDVWNIFLPVQTKANQKSLEKVVNGQQK